MVDGFDEIKKRSDAIGHLLRIEFPNSSYARYWGKAKPPPPSRLGNTSPRREDSASTLRRVKDFESTLQTLSTDELVQKRRLSIERENAEREASFQFNHSSSRADHAYWARVSTWSEEEIVALSLDRDPRNVDWDRIKSHKSISTFVKSYEDRRRIVSRAIQAGQLFRGTIPSVFIAWAERMQIGIPAQMKHEIEAIGLQIADWKTLYDKAIDLNETHKRTIDHYKATYEAIDNNRTELNQALETALQKIEELKSDRSERSNAHWSLEKKSLLKLLAAMAIAGYSFDPRVQRNSATKDIQDDLDRLGISLDRKTILRWIREACDLVDPNHLE